MSRSDGLRFAVVTAFVTEDWHSARLLSAFERVGEAVVVDPADLTAHVAGRQVRVTAAGRDASEFDAFVLVRGLSPRGDAEVQFAIYRALEESGALVVNRIGPLLDAQDKMRTSILLARAGVPTPPAAVVQSPAEAVAVLRQMGEVVAKPMTGSLGLGVERLELDAESEQRLARRVIDEGVLYLQQWVPNSGWDVRGFVIGGQLAGAVERVAAPGEFRTNVARGARPRPVILGAELTELAQASAVALGLDYTGVDIIEGPDGPQVIEVNGNPAFDMILEATGQDMAGAIAQHVVRLARERREASGRDGPSGWDRAAFGPARRGAL